MIAPARVQGYCFSVAEEKVPFMMLTADIPDSCEHFQLTNDWNSAREARTALAEIAMKLADLREHHIERAQFEGRFFAWYYVGGVPRAVVEVNGDCDTPLWTAIPGFLK